MNRANRAAKKLLQRAQLIALGGIGAIAVLAWVSLASMASGSEMANMSEMAPMHDMSNMPGMAHMSSGDMSVMSELRPWTAADAALTFLMWTIMMVAMMTPSATPVILLYARVARDRDDPDSSAAPIGAFYLGYLMLWFVFSLLVTLLQGALTHAALLSPMMASTSPMLGGLFLIAAGVYQLLPVKDICLRHCRSPVQYLSAHWRPGALGALRMGLEHGAYCVGCCWVLMLLLFVGGVMNMLWVSALAAFVLIEKAAPFGWLLGRAGALLLIVWGIVVFDGG